MDNVNGTNEMSETPVANAAADALRASLRSLRSSIEWSEGARIRSFRDFQTALARLQEERAAETQILVHLAQNGWLTPEDLAPIKEEAPF